MRSWTLNWWNDILANLGKEWMYFTRGTDWDHWGPEIGPMIGKILRTTPKEFHTCKISSPLNLVGTCEYHHLSLTKGKLFRWVKSNHKGPFKSLFFRWQHKGKPERIWRLSTQCALVSLKIEGAMGKDWRAAAPSWQPLKKQNGTQLSIGMTLKMDSSLEPPEKSSA